MKKRKPLAMVTLNNEQFKAFALDSVPGKAAYCVEHGYGFISCSISNTQERPASWYRLKMLEEYWDAYRWLFCTDSDSVIWNPELPLWAHVDDAYDLIVTMDSSGLNTGNYFLRSTPWMKKFVKGPWWSANEKEIHHHTWEQHRLRVLYKTMPELRRRTKVVSQTHFNAFAAEPETIIMHYSGLASLSERLEIQRQRQPTVPSHPEGNTRI